MEGSQRQTARDPLDDDFDPKRFVKRVEAEVDFDSDGEPDFQPRDKNFSPTLGMDESEQYR